MSVRACGTLLVLAYLHVYVCGCGCLCVCACLFVNVYLFVCAERQRTESGVKVPLMTPKVKCLQGCAAFARCHPDLDALASHDHV